MILNPELLIQEGWKVVTKEVNGNETYSVQTQYENDIGLLPLKHPALVHLDIYRKHLSSEIRYQHLKRAHDYLWPTNLATWHEWTERRFRTFCEDWNYITLAAGASASKSYDVATYAILFWYANPSERGVVVASVTLSSLLTRVWGYLTAHMKKLALPLPYKYYRSNPPRILLEEPPTGKNKIDDDTLHGIFAVTAKLGDDDQAVATWIGKHPKEKLLVILDEATDMPMSILNSLPNLNSHPEKFQLIGIGNSNSTMDLHGILSTPKAGWDSINIDLIQWDTTQPKGTCLYFSPYDSPAITHPDPETRKILSNFLISKEILKTKEKELGTDSEKFYRWVLGFWKSRGTENVTVSEGFLKDFNPRLKPEWSGYYPLHRIASLDPSFSTGGDSCILRIATVGHSMDLKLKIDLHGDAMTFDIKMKAIQEPSIERQIAEAVVDLLTKYSVTLDMLAVDVTGQGRAIGEVIKLINERRNRPLGSGTPLKIYSMSPHNLHKTKKSVPDLTPISSYELYETIRKFIEQDQVCNLDDKTIYQLTNRIIEQNPKTGKKSLEPKLMYKRRQSALGIAHSPDEADSCAGLFQIMEKRLGIFPGTIWNIPEKYKHFDKRTADKMFAAFGTGSLQGTGEMVIEADCSGGLDNYLEHKKYF